MARTGANRAIESEFGPRRARRLGRGRAPGRALFLIGALVLAGCASDGLSFPKPFAGASVNYAAGSVLGAQLAPSDQRALEPVFLKAVADGEPGERFDWRAEQSFGWVKGRERVLGGLRPRGDDRPTYPKELVIDRALETEKGLYAVKSAANVRIGPSTDHAVVDKFTAGDGVDVVGKVVGAPWMLVAVDNDVVGYVHDSLLKKAPGSEFELAGGPTRKPTPCRAFEQRISLNGRSDLWRGVACFEEGEWVLTARPQSEPVLLN